MMRRLRGRNLSHIGCTLGLALGLTIGLVLAALVLQLSSSWEGAAIAVFLGATLALGIAGLVVGSALTRRLWGGAQPPR